MNEEICLPQLQVLNKLTFFKKKSILLLNSIRTVLTLIHNNSCSKSNCLHDYLIIQNISFKLRDYLVTPLSADELRKLIQQLKTTTNDFEISSLVRKSDVAFLPYAGLDLQIETEVVRLLSERPELLQRPILTMGDKAVIGRPFEVALEFLKAELG